MLSLGPDGLDLELQNLNVLIGPNGSGKSSFLELLELLRAPATSDSLAPIRQGGGIAEWIWKGSTERSDIFLEVLVDDGKLEDSSQSSLSQRLRLLGKRFFRHYLSWYPSQDKFQLSDERVENDRPYGNHKDVIF